MNLHATKKIASLATAALMLASISVPAFAADAASDETVIKIFHTNDVHSRYESATNDDGTLSQFGYARLKTLINQNTDAGDHVLLLDAGDTFHGQPFATLNEGDSIAKVMRAVGYDAMCPGNHDFNYGAYRLAELGRHADVPVLAANVKRANGESPAYMQDYLVFDEGGVKVGVFGMATPETKFKTNPKNVQFLKFEDPTETAQKMVDTLRNEEEVDVVVCLNHLGVDDSSEGLRSTDVAAAVDGIDLIIDGHSHTPGEDYEVVNDTVINSAGQYMEEVGMVTITVDEAGEVEVAADQLKASDYTEESLPAAPSVQKVIDEVKASQESILSQVVASTPVKLLGERENVRTSETNLAHLITAAMLNETGADVAITNGGGIRASIEAGEITVGDVQNVLPFGNYIVTVKLTGAQLKEAVENGLPGRSGGSLEVIGKMAQVGGLEVTYNPDAPEGSRIVTITHNGEEIDDNATYLVATNDFMQSGGDGYTSLNQPIENEFAALDEAVISYMKQIGSDGVKALSEETPNLQIAK